VVQKLVPSLATFEALLDLLISQSWVPSLATLEALLDLLISQCRMEKAFLFDVMTKVSSPHTADFERIPE
ncbi:hypothetical protein T484DRAFT_1767007, partial [Baffinella frigidus]